MESGDYLLASLEQSIKRVVGEAHRICRERNCEAEPLLLAYLVCQTEVQQGWGAEGGLQQVQAMSSSQVSSLALKVVEKLTGSCATEIATGKLQVMAEKLYHDQRKHLEKAQHEQDEELEMLQRAITAPRPLASNTIAAYEKFYNLVLDYCARKGGLLASEGPGRTEARVALESVFPVASLAYFLTLTQQEKAQQVDELTRVTVGICLYHQSSGAASSVLPAGASTCLQQGRRLLRELEGRVQLLEQRVRVAQGAAAAGVAGEQAEEAIATLTYTCQVLVIFQALQQDLLSSISSVQQLDQELQRCMEQIAEAVGDSKAVEKSEVLPLMDHAGALHAALLWELRLLVAQQRVHDTVAEAVASTPCSSAEISAPNESNAASEGRPPLQLAEGAEYLPASQSGEAFRGMALRGFCPVQLADSSASLSLGQPALGTIRFNGAVYAFSSWAALEAFSSSPQAFQDSVRAQLSRTPLLVPLLGQQAGFPLLDLAALFQVMSAAPVKSSFGTQTPTHFVEKHIEANYEWNQWALRRRAIHMANLRSKATHSAQTLLSHFRRDGAVQVWQPKQTTTQTMVNKGQSMPKKLRYVAGLRGAPTVSMSVVQLHLDLGQPHQH